MIGFGKLVTAYIYIGLFFGLMIFTLTSVLIVYIIVDKSLVIQDRIKEKRHKDSVDIVRCKDCKYYYQHIKNGVNYFNLNSCEKGLNVNYPNFYCAYGERKEDGQVEEV